MMNFEDQSTLTNELIVRQLQLLRSLFDIQYLPVAAIARRR